MISDKPSGLVVDYIGTGCELKQALKVGPAFCPSDLTRRIGRLARHIRVVAAFVLRSWKGVLRS